MEPPRTVRLITADDRQGTVELPPDEWEGDILVHLDEGRQLRVPADILEARDDGSYYLPVDVSELEARRERAGVQITSSDEDETIIIPLAEEELEVSKRSYSTGGLRVTKRVHEREETIDETGFRQEVDIERVPVNREIDEPVSSRMDGDTLIVPLMEEVLVVEKRLVLKEELHITRRAVETPQPDSIRLRREEATIERIPGDEPGREEDDSEVV